MLKYLWQAKFLNDGVMTQPEDDRYSKYSEDDPATHKSSFTDIIDYSRDVSPLAIFSLHGREGETYAVNLITGEFFINGSVIWLDQPLEELQDRKIIYYRTMRSDMITKETRVHAFNFGYEGKHPESGKIVKKVITIV